MSAEVEIRPERPGDGAAIRRVHAGAFPGPGEADLVDALRAAGDLVGDLCLVAERDGEVVGHVAISRAELDSGVAVLALAPVGVLPAQQRAGIGSVLMRAVVERAAATDFPLIVLLGHADYYPRFGFEPADPLGVHAPFDVPPENWMAYRLPAHTPRAPATVRYADAFAALG